MNFLANSRVPFLSSLMTISASHLKNMVDSPFSADSGGVHLKFPRLGIIGMLFYHLYCLGMLARLVCTAVTLNSEGVLLPNYLHYDLLMGFLRRVNFIDGYLALVGWPSMVLAIVLDYTVRFSRQTVSYRLSYDLVVVNKDRFWLLNAHLLNNGVGHLFGSLLGKQQSFGKSIIFNSPKLQYFPHLSHSVRVKAVALSLLFDLVIGISSLLLRILGVICALYYYHLINFRWAYPKWASSVMVLEAVVIMYMVWRSTQVSFFLIHCIYRVLFVHVARQRE
ncbi:hypothetical protein TYRP_023784 [Tyrophagus putrescentiae]|nr:hypothetical protein TYRP_023784 [Tyrophagus putrescentiae]